MDYPSAGNCHRYGPQPLTLDPKEGQRVVDVVWPRTSKHDWCGEWVTSVGIEEAKTGQ
jgi:hypothetical protein